MTARATPLPKAPSAPLAGLSVIVPVGPGDAVSPALLHRLHHGLPASAEVLIVLAPTAIAPRDDQLGPAMHLLHDATGGRARLQNRGAAQARYAVLWFVHADTVIPLAALQAAARFVDRGESALAYFDLRFLADGPRLMVVNAVAANLRSRWLKLPFGDQGLMIRRDDFQRLGGFDAQLRAGEDHALVWRARHDGLPLRRLAAPLYTSARKYAEHGWFRTTAWHLSATWRQARRFARDRSSP